MRDFKRFVAMLLLVGILCSFAVPVTFAEEAAPTEPVSAADAAETTFPDEYPYNVTYKDYLAMTEEEQSEFYNCFSKEEFKTWYTAAKKEYDDSFIKVEIDENGTIDFKKEGTIGDNLTWVLDRLSGELTISGEGDMFCWSLIELPWLEEQDTVTNVVIEEGVTSIGQKAFYNWKNLKSVTIPASVTRIKEGAFTGCSALDVVNFGGTQMQWESVQIGENNEYLYNASFSFTEEPSPIASLEFAPVSVIENTCGDWDQTSGFFRYDLWTVLSDCAYTITFCDGTVLTRENNWEGGFTYAGEWYDFTYTALQDVNNQWTAGNTYPVTVSVLGQSAEVPVTITLSPVESFVVAPITIFEHTNGYWQSEYNPDTGNLDRKYFYYNGFEILKNASYTITFRDGTVCTGTGNNGFSYDGRWYYLDYMAQQSYDNQWTVGNTYIMTISTMGEYSLGVSTNVQVTVAEAPSLESLEFTPVSILKETCGYWAGYYENDNYTEYYYYDSHTLLQKTTYTATFGDGTVISGSGDYFYYNGVRCSFGYNDGSQGYDNQWIADNTYAITVSVLGKTAQVPVTIEATPLASLEFTPLFIEAETCGYWSSHIDVNNQWFEYYYYDSWTLRGKINYTATFKDGTVITGRADEGFYYNGQWYNISYNMPYQSYEDRWLPGNTYNISFTVLGMTVQCPITVCEAANAGGYTYLNQNGMAIITDCTLKDAVLQIPDTIDGLPVVGITSLGSAIKTATKIVIPDSVRMLSGSAFKFTGTDMYESEDNNLIPLQELTVGSGVSNLSMEMLRKARSLEKIVVAAGNPNYSTVDGVVYSKDYSKLIAYPPAKTGMHYVPDSVTDVSVIVNNPQLYSGIRITFGASVTDYVIEDGVIYSGDMTCVLMATGNAPQSYVMPDTVTDMAEKAFAGSNLKEVTISSGVTSIVYFAFGGCKQLEKVNIPSSVISIDSGAFQGCTSLKSADIPGSVRSIFYAAYEGCDGLEKVNITDLEAWCNIYFSDATANPLHKAKNLYMDGEKVTDLVIPDTVTDICYYNFTCADLGAVTLPEGLMSLGQEVFANSTLTSISMPESVTQLGRRTFFGCKNLRSIQLSEGLDSIPDGCFRQSGLKTVTIPASVSYIGYQAFRESELNEVVFNCKDVFFGDNAFSYCPLKELNLEGLNSLGEWETFTGTLVTQLQVPDTVTQITYRIFAFNENLVSVTIPESVEMIWNNAFEGDENLSHVLYQGTQTQWAAIQNTYGEPGILSEELNSATIHYEAVGNEVTVQQTCTTISFYCSICDKWETVTKTKANHNLVNGVCVDCGHKGDWGYEVDPAAEAVTITSYFGESTDVKIPETIKGYPVVAIAGSAFYRNRKITSVEIPGSVRAIADDAFYGCVNLAQVTLGEGVTEIGNFAFYDCDSLKGVELPDSVETIGEYAFALSGLKSIVIPQKVTQIAYGTFSSSNLITVTIPETVKKIDTEAFAWIWSVKDVYFTGSADQWDAIEVGENNFNLLEANIHFAKACQHSRIEEGICATCGEQIGSILTDGEGNKQTFATFEEALEAAREGQTLSMHTDAEEGELILPSGVELDLNGHTLTADSVLTFNGGDIVDNSEDVSGLLKIGEFDGNMISSTNSQLPVYDKDSGGFRFFAVDVESRAVTGKGGENLKYWFKIDTRNFGRFNSLVQGGAKLQIKVRMTWDGQSEPVYAAADMDFVKYWAEGFENNDRLCITVSATGGENLTNFELTPCMVANGVEIAGDELS